MSQLTPTELLFQLKSFTSHPPPSLSENPELRNQLYYAAQAAMVSFEDNADPISRVAVAQQAEWVAMCTSCELGLYPALAAENDPKTLVELHKLPVLIPPYSVRHQKYQLQWLPILAEIEVRFLRAGVSFGSIKEIGLDRYSLSLSYAILGNPEVATSLPEFADFVHKIFYATPALLVQNGFQNSNDPLNTAMQLAFDAPGRAPYEIFVSKPESAKAIGTILAAMGVPKFYRIESVYPIHERLVQGFDESLKDAFFVDIGAGNAHVVAGLRSAMPDLPGRLVAQDLPFVVGAVSGLPPGVEVQAHDFFTEQPIKYARAYYMRLCLHNWQDKECITILTRIKEAMKPGYSRLIIHEQVMPDHGPHPWAAVSDINQMGANAPFERTKEQWSALLKAAGLEKPKFYLPKSPSAAIAIESSLNN